jgi:hypothetical protein
MNRTLLWITTAVLGAAAALITGIGGLVGGLLLLLALPLIMRGDHAVALSGLLTGFGALWSFGLARQFATGGTLDNAQFWTAIGVVPLVIGCVLLALVVARGLRRSNAGARTSVQP